MGDLENFYFGSRDLFKLIQPIYRLVASLKNTNARMSRFSFQFLSYCTRDGVFLTKLQLICFLANILKIGLSQICFPVNFAKFFRKVLLRNTSDRLQHQCNCLLDLAIKKTQALISHVFAGIRLVTI